jgi:hypothetical protein
MARSLAHITALVEAGKLKPLLNDHVIPKADIDTADALVESGAVGKVVSSLAVNISRGLYANERLYLVISPIPPGACVCEKEGPR